MIYEFNFSNFRSYKSEANLDLTSKPITEFRNTLIQADDSTNVLPVCVIYGPNGGGKSSVCLLYTSSRECGLIFSM